MIVNPKSKLNGTKYYAIEKSASTSMIYLLKTFNNFTLELTHKNQLIISNCGFTVVRNPFNRFISAYYTINMLLFKDYILKNNQFKVPEYLTFWKIHGEPSRFNKFVDELIKYKYDFIKYHALNHLVTQSQILSIAKIDLQYILKFENITHHYNYIVRNMKHCHLQYIPKNKWPTHMKGYGYNHIIKGLNDSQMDMYYKMMSLKQYNPYSKESVLPVLYHMDINTYHKIINYYKQDYVCFGYHYDYHLDTIS